MDNKTKHYLIEISIRKRNLETKQQVQCAENKKELEMLMAWESSLEKIQEEEKQK